MTTRCLHFTVSLFKPKLSMILFNTTFEPLLISEEPFSCFALLIFPHLEPRLAKTFKQGKLSKNFKL